MEKDPDSLIQISHAEETATLEVLAKLGVKQRHFRKIRSLNDFAGDVASVIKDEAVLFEKMFHRDFEGMHHFFGVGAYWKYFQIKLWELPSFKVPPITNQIWGALKQNCPFTLDQNVNQTHVLFLGVFENEKLLSIGECKERISIHTENLSFSWVLMYHVPILRTDRKDWKVALRQMPKNYVLATSEYITVLENINHKMAKNYSINNTLINRVRVSENSCVSFNLNNDGYIDSEVKFLSQGVLPPLRVWRKIN